MRCFDPMYTSWFPPFGSICSTGFPYLRATYRIPVLRTKDKVDRYKRVECCDLIKSSPSIVIVFVSCCFFSS
ncbi:alpha/beta-hydrolase [Moniliophthora roreri]|nr:alpha/beta-hydrolase [Moniliophthora roreri]